MVSEDLQQLLYLHNLILVELVYLHYWMLDLLLVVLSYFLRDINLTLCRQIGSA